jgi:hypothetical protein
MPRTLYLCAYKKPKTAEIQALAGERQDGSLPCLDGFLRYPFRNSVILSFLGSRPNGLTERLDGLTERSDGLH